MYLTVLNVLKVVHVVLIAGLGMAKKVKLTIASVQHILHAVVVIASLQTKCLTKELIPFQCGMAGTARGLDESSNYRFIHFTK